jgi:hypothetical protein
MAWVEQVSWLAWSCPRSLTVIDLFHASIMLAPLELEIAGSLNTELALPRHFYSPPHGNLSLLTPVVARSGRADAGEAGILPWV